MQKGYFVEYISNVTSNPDAIKNNRILWTCNANI